MEKDTHNTFNDDMKSVNSQTVEEQFARVKSHASVVKKHIRDEEIKLMMFSDILQKEVANS